MNPRHAAALALGFLAMAAPIAHAQTQTQSQSQTQTQPQPDEPGPDETNPPEPSAMPSNLDRLVAADSPLKSGQTIVFFGDSITQAGGYIRILRDRLAADRPDLDVTLVNRGHSGYRVPMIRPLLQEEVLDMDPALVVIYIGINDVWHKANGGGTTPEDFEAGLRDMITRSHDAGVKVVLCSPSIIGEFPRGSNPLDADLEAYSAISRRVAAETGAVFCDLRTPFFEYLAEHKTDRSDRGVLTTDGVHMRPAGDALLIETMAGAIRAAMGAAMGG
jgi:lysophospholipase L1-like esterase